MDFETLHARAWDDHASDAAAVAAQLDECIALVADEAQLNQLMLLGHHVHGEHLGRWHQGIEFIHRLAALPMFDADGLSGQTHRRCVASLRLAAGEPVDDVALTASDRIRVAAMAASALAERDSTRAMRLMRDALDGAQCAGLPDDDPMNRALAVTGHNIACTLEEKPDRNQNERELMILAARTSRHYWGLIGTWLQAERGEYRLAHTWLHAGDLARAREHALACLEIVAANDGPALERLFGWEALGLVERAVGNATGHAHALARAREAFDQLDDSDKTWCAASIDKLAAAGPG